MAKVSSELLVAGTGAIYVAPVGTTLPTTDNATLDSAFFELGYTTEDGATFVESKEIRESKAWQAFYPLRRTVTSRSAEARFSLMQWNAETVELAFGGGTWELVTSGHYRYVPPDPEYVDERAMVLDILDGTEKWRIVIPKGMVTSNTESNFRRTDDAVLPITFGITVGDGEEPWYLATNAEAIGLSS